MRFAGRFYYFKYGGIPNYASGTFVTPQAPSFAAPSFSASAPNITFAPEITIVVEGEIDEARIKAVSIRMQDSDEGRRVTLKNVKILKQNREM